MHGMSVISALSLRLVLSGCLIFSACVKAPQAETIAAPAPARISVAGKPVASLPAEMLLSGGILLRARVEDSAPLWFVLDSGAGSRFIVDRRRADGLGLALHGRATATGAGPRPHDMTFAHDVRIALAGVG